MSTLWTSWTLGGKLRFTYIKGEPYVIDYLLTFEEGQDGINYDGARLGQASPQGIAIAWQRWFLWNPRWWCIVCGLWP